MEDYQGIESLDDFTLSFLTYSADIIENEPFTKQDKLAYLYFKQQEKISVENTIKVHEVLMSDKNVDFVLGKVRSRSVWVGDKECLQAILIKTALDKLFQWWDDLKEITAKEILLFHILFLYIHPFLDGNGRVARIITHVQAQKNNINVNNLEMKWLYDLKANKFINYYPIFRDQKEIFLNWCKSVNLKIN